jgi:hypothetical protein
MGWMDVRQRFYTREFRIPKLAISPTAVSALVVAMEPSTRTPAATPRFMEQVKHEEQFARLAVDIGNAAWRLKLRLVDPQPAKPTEEMRKLYRHVETIWDALTSAGIEIQDHTNQPFRTGLALDVIAFEPTVDMVRETVVETVAPSIYYRNGKLQTGKVIVGTPKAAD